MKKLMRCSIFMVLAACSYNSQEKDEVMLNPKNIMQAISSTGGRNYLNAIYSDKVKWRKILSNISAGNSEWLILANQLHRYSDAGSSEQLKFAVGERLAKDPGGVFKLIASGSEFSLDEICSAIDIDDSRFDGAQLALFEIDRRKKSVSALPDAKYYEDKNRCNKMLDAAIISVENFYKK